MKRFIKIIITVVLSITVLINNLIIGYAKDTADNQNNTLLEIEENAYDPNSIDWDSIDEITVFFYSQTDPFLVNFLNLY